MDDTLTQKDGKINGGSSVLSVVEYRELLNDTASTDEQIRKRLEYLESFCRAVIRKELRQYAK